MLTRIGRLPLALIAAALLVFGATAPNALPAAHAAGASIHLNRYSAGWGDAVTVTGYGFAPDDTIVVTMPYKAGTSSQVVRTLAGTDQTGAFQATFTVPGNASQSLYTVEARDFHGHYATAPLYVLALVYLKPGTTPFYWVIANHGFFVRGTGFTPGETVNLSARFAVYGGYFVTVNRQGQANGNGNLNEVFVPIPARTVNNSRTSITGKGAASGKSATAKLGVVYHPYIALKDTTILPGTNMNLTGHDFVPNSKVDVSITIPRSGATSITITRTVPTDAHGNFTASVGVPSYAPPGRYTVTAYDQTGHFKATTALTLAIHPSITVKPTTLYPGQATTITGGGFSAGATVTISGTFSTSSGKRTVNVSTTSSGSGGISTQFAVPANALPGTVVLTAKGPNGQASSKLTVHGRPPTPTATARPAAPTATPVPATATPTPLPLPHARPLGFQWISIWYHVVRLGTFNHVTVQATHHKKLGIWVHIYFPSGLHYDYYEATNNHGRWNKQFSVPTTAYSKYGNIVVITFRLWEGNHSKRNHRTFTVVG